MASKEYVRFLLDAPLAEPTETDYQDAAEGLLEEMGHLNALHDARQTSSDDSGWAAMVVDEGEGATDLISEGVVSDMSGPGRSSTSRSRSGSRRWCRVWG